jgi:nicotinamidase-related amidase
VTTEAGQQHDLHGSAPHTHECCLLLIDVITDFDFPRGAELAEQAFPIAQKIAALKRRARAAGVPCVYANDNFGHWRSDLNHIVRHCLRDESNGREFVKLLAPEPEDYFVLKPKHSAFYQTPLDLLLKHFGTKRLVLTGLSSNSCVLFTANDAYMRDIKIDVPQDCIAACSQEEHCFALAHMKEMLKANTRPSTQLDFPNCQEI